MRISFSWFYLCGFCAGAAMAGETALNGHQFTLPEGFEITVAAEPPLVDRPIMLDADEQGRVYVADSSGSNAAPEQQLREKPHRVLRLEDTDGDGAFDRRTVFADRLMFPEGVLWHRGSLYVGAPPSIWKLTDTDDDGIADQREEWFNGQTLTGCANDLHGPYLGRDGWIYWCKGAFAEQTHARPDGTAFVSSAAHIFRRHPDQPWVEPVMTGGMDNPVEVVFSPEGERFFTTTFLQHPGGGRRDGIIHAIYGGVYGKNHHVIDTHPQTGDLMPVMVHLGPAAACSLALYESNLFGEDFKNNLFSSEFNLRSVTRHVLRPSGASFVSESSPFLVSDQLDFHPTDVFEDADGSLLVVDTGGWYKLCCPTSQLQKPDVLGAIYRVRKTGQRPLKDPLGGLLSWETPAADHLGDERLAVRKRAIEALAQKGDIDSLKSLLGRDSKGSLEAKQAAVWALTRIDSPQARALVRTVLTDAANAWPLRQVAAHSVGVWRDRQAAEGLLGLIAALDTPAAVKRASAEALGRLKEKSAVPVLLGALGRDAVSGDRALEHSLIYALIETGASEPLKAALQRENVAERRAALIALDQMRPSGSTPEMVLAMATGHEPLLQETAMWLLGKHSDWAGQVAEYVSRRLDDPRSLALVRQLADEKPIQEMIADQLGGPRAEALLGALAGVTLNEPSTALLSALAKSLTTPLRSLGLSVLAGFTVKPEARQEAGLVEAFATVAGDESVPLEERLQALSLAALTDLRDSDFALAERSLAPTQPLRTRSLASRALLAASLASEQKAKLAKALTNLAPMELTQLLPIFSKENDQNLGLSLVAALQANKAVDTVPVAAIKSAFEASPLLVRERLLPLLDKLEAGLSNHGATVDALLDRLPEGDIRRGQTVFNSTEAACITCHEIGYRGGNVGPDLTSVGEARSKRDLLEAIMYPSASFVRSYESVTITTKDGSTYLGIQRDATPETLTLVVGPAAEVVLNQGDIVDKQPASVSLMPQGIHTQLTEQQLADLLAFLKGTRWR